MCERKDHPNYYRCEGLIRHHVNREGHEMFEPDTDQERHHFKPLPLCSMTPEACRQRRKNAKKKIAEVEAIRVVHGVKPDVPIGPVLREELWANRAGGGGLSQILLAERLQAVADDEGVDVAVISRRHQNQQIVPYRQRAGERLAALVVPDPGRPDWVDSDRLVRAVEPPANGMLGPAYLSIVCDDDDVEWVLARSYDGSEPMAWRHDRAGLMAAMSETLDRVRLAEASDDYQDNFAPDSPSAANPWTQDMTTSGFLAESGSGGMHLI